MPFLGLSDKIQDWHCQGRTYSKQLLLFIWINNLTGHPVSPVFYFLNLANQGLYWVPAVLCSKSGRWPLGSLPGVGLWVRVLESDSLYSNWASPLRIRAPGQVNAQVMIFVKLPFPHLWNGDKKSTDFLELSWGFRVSGKYVLSTCCESAPVLRSGGHSLCPHSKEWEAGHGEFK